MVKLKSRHGDIPDGPVVRALPSNVEGEGLIPGWGAKIQKKKEEHKQQKQYCNKFNKDFINGPHQKKIKKEK